MEENQKVEKRPAEFRPAGDKSAKEDRMDQSQFLEEVFATQNKLVKRIVESLGELKQTEMMAQHHVEMRKLEMQELEASQSILNNYNYKVSIRLKRVPFRNEKCIKCNFHYQQIRFSATERMLFHL